MKIILATYGSRGDVQPMLAISLALQSRGHNVLLIGPPEKQKWATQLGCPYCPLGRNLTAFLDEMNNAHSLTSLVRFSLWIRREMSAQFPLFQEVIKGADLVIGASLVFPLATIAEALGISYRFIAFTPQLFPSSHHPFLFCKNHSFPHWYNRLTWQVVKTLDRFNLQRLINKERLKLGLNPIQDAWHHILGSPVIVATDKELAEVPPDVMPAYVQTGYMHLDQPKQHLPSLEKFLDDGSPPVYAGFGSMPRKDQIRNVRLIVDAARSVDRRIVINKFWDEPHDLSKADDVFFIKQYPHLHLFPRMAVIIHHGGAGTTASAAFSGVPQIIVPHALDQYYWGKQIFQANLGPQPIWRSRLTSKRLGCAIRKCVTNQKTYETAKSVSRKIRQRDGIELTVQAIEALG